MYWILALASSSLASGQHLGILAPQETVGSPTSEPLQRHFIGAEPMTLYRELLSSSLEDRRQALQHLGSKAPDANQVVDARLYALNLDSDVDLEYVLIASLSPAATIAWVLTIALKAGGLLVSFPTGGTGMRTTQKGSLSSVRLFGLAARKSSYARKVVVLGLRRPNYQSTGCTTDICTLYFTPRRIHSTTSTGPASRITSTGTSNIRMLIMTAIPS